MTSYRISLIALLAFSLSAQQQRNGNEEAVKKLGAIPLKDWAPDSRYATGNSFRFLARSGRRCASRTSSTRCSILDRPRR